MVSDILAGAGKSQTFFISGTPSLSYRETNVFIAVGIVTIAQDRLHWISDVSTSCWTPAWKDTNYKLSVKGHMYLYTVSPSCVMCLENKFITKAKFIDET